MASTLPENPRAWETMARQEGMLDKTIHELEEIPPASKIQLCQFLALRVLWVPIKAADFDVSYLGVSQDYKTLAARFLKENRFLHSYIEDVEAHKNQRPAQGPIGNLGTFTLARYYQLQITPEDKEDESHKFNISPIKTRSKTTAMQRRPETPENRNPTPEPLDMEELRPHFSKDSSPGMSSSSSGEPALGDSPLAGRQRHNPLLSHRSASKSSSEQDQPQSLSEWSAARSSAAATHYQQTEDEQIVNIALILFANAITIQCAEARAEWTPVRKVFQTNLQKASFEARTDGFLRGVDKKSVEAIVEVKPRIRQKRQRDVQVQEAAQMVSWIIADGLHEPKSRCYLLVSQDRHEVYLTIAEYDAGYIKYLKGRSGDTDDDSSKGKDPEAKSFLKMRSFGPWNIYSPSHVRDLAHILLAFTIKIIAHNLIKGVGTYTLPDDEYNAGGLGRWITDVCSSLLNQLQLSSFDGVNNHEGFPVDIADADYYAPDVGCFDNVSTGGSSKPQAALTGLLSASTSPHAGGEDIPAEWPPSNAFADNIAQGHGHAYEVAKVDGKSHDAEGVEAAVAVIVDADDVAITLEKTERTAMEGKQTTGYLIAKSFLTNTLLKTRGLQLVQLGLFSPWI